MRRDSVQGSSDSLFLYFDESDSFRYLCLCHPPTLSCNIICCISGLFGTLHLPDLQGSVLNVSATTCTCSHIADAHRSLTT
mmetsp:Transcript_10199/g.15301  ORF Transcript_10199/g.15301 Transcript_10199/m.15301 type:complete len:81 (+) Transcript_10199:643-885(+)